MIWNYNHALFLFLFLSSLSLSFSYSSSFFLLVLLFYHPLYWYVGYNNPRLIEAARSEEWVTALVNRPATGNESYPSLHNNISCRNVNVESSCPNHHWSSLLSSPSSHMYFISLPLSLPLLLLRYPTLSNMASSSRKHPHEGSSSRLKPSIYCYVWNLRERVRLQSCIHDLPTSQTWRETVYRGGFEQLHEQPTPRNARFEYFEL